MTQVAAFNPNEYLTKLPQGKDREGKERFADYLEVKYRLVWFREQCPAGTIDTEEILVDLDRECQTEAWVWNNEARKKEKVVKIAKGYARYKAIVTDGKGGRASAHKSESAVNFEDYIEKAETGAVGRALAMLGYGTQFTGDELAEHQRIVDAPVEAKNGHHSVQTSSSPSNNGKAVSRPSQSEIAGNGQQDVQEPASPAPDDAPTPGQLRANFKALGLDKKGTFEQFVKAKLGQPLNDEALNQTHCRALSKRLDEVEKATTGAGGGR